MKKLYKFRFGLKRFGQISLRKIDFKN